MLQIFVQEELIFWPDKQIDIYFFLIFVMSILKTIHLSAAPKESYYIVLLKLQI